MSSHPIFCPRCGSANDPGAQCCHLCEQGLHSQAPHMPPQPLLMSPSHKPVARHTRRRVLLGITATMVTSSIIAGSMYMATQRRFNSSPLLLREGARDAAWSPDGMCVASVGLGEAVQVWNATTGEKRLTCHLSQTATAMELLGVVWSADGKSIIACASENGKWSAGPDLVQIWDATTGQRRRCIAGVRPVTQDSVIPWVLNERYLAIVKRGPDSVSRTNDESIEIWEIATGRKTASLKLAGQVTPLETVMVWEPGGEKLAVFTYDNHLWQIWDVPTGKMIQALPAVDQAYSMVTAWSPDGRSIALGTGIYDMQTGRRVMMYTVEGGLVSQAWSPNGKRLAVRSFTGTGLYTSHSSILSLQDASNGEQIARYDQGKIEFGENMPSNPRKMAWSPTGKNILMLRDAIEIWRMEEG